MYQGTTPSIVYNVKNFDMTGAKLFVSFKQGTKDVITKTEGVTVVYDDIENVSTVVCPLTQEETLALKQGGVQTQIRFVFANGQAYATNIVSLDVRNVLLQGVISYE